MFIDYEDDNYYRQAIVDACTNGYVSISIRSSDYVLIFHLTRREGAFLWVKSGVWQSPDFWGCNRCRALEINYNQTFGDSLKVQFSDVQNYVIECFRDLLLG